MRYHAPRPGQTDHELVWGTLALILLGAAWSFPAWRRVAAGFFCPFRVLTHLPCVFCGGTRTLHLLTHGRWSEAFRLNPLAALLGMAAVGYLCYAAFALITGRRITLGHAAGKWTVRALVLGGLAAAALNWTYLILNRSALSP